MGFRADSTVVFIMQVLARNTPPIPNCIPRTSLTHRVAHLAFDADDEPPLPPRPEPLPRQPKPNQVGPRRVFSTWAEYEAALAEYMHQKYQDAMAIVRKKSKPSFFITMTCNPYWSEIVDSTGTV